MINPLFLSHLKENIDSQIKILIFFGGFTHIGFFIFGIFFGIWQVSVYSGIAAIVFLFAGVFIHISNFVVFYVLTFIEIIINAVWLEFSVNTSLGFPLYFFVLIPVSIYILFTEHSRWFRIIFLGCSFFANIFGYLFFQILSSLTPATDISLSVLLTFSVYNTVCVGFMLGFLSLYFMLHMQSQFSIIEEENSVLSEMSFRDELTGLYNRRFMKDFLEKAFASSDKEFCVAMSDLDFFKQFNDRFGHEAGDLILKTTASLLSPYSEETKISVCRWGGEEFLFYFPMPPQKAELVLNQIRENIEKSVLAYKDKLLQVTMTFGISDSAKNYGLLSQMIDDADSRLYRGKNEGRNRVVL